jgi:AcrR family transcriptional regulator
VSPRPQIDHIRRPQLLAAAADVIAERGFAQTRIADVAERAGTSAASVLYWFESRDKLLTEALSHAERRFHDEVTAELETIGSPAVRLATLIERSIGGDDWILWIELWARALRDPDVRESRRLLDESWREQIRAVVAEGQATGAFGGPDPERVALELASLIDGLAVQVALDDRQVSAEVMRVTCFEVAERLLEVELTVTSELAA